jgi:uncharacterized membrane protein YhaH (DUF805 family)
MTKTPRLAFTSVDTHAFYLSPKGRVTRLQFLTFSVVVRTLMGVLSFAFGATLTMAVLNPPLYSFAVIASLVLFWPQFVVTAKRLHDIGHSAAWAWVTFVPTVLSFLIGYVLSYPEHMGLAAYVPAMKLASLLSGIAIWGLIIVLCIVPGDKYPNVYGTPP